MTSLSIHDSLSYRQSIALSAEAVTDRVNSKIMAQYYAGDKARNMLMLNILAECAAVLSAPGLDADQTYCKKAWPQCVKQLAKNAQTSGVAVPKWLGDDIPGKGWGGGKSEL